MLGKKKKVVDQFFEVFAGEFVRFYLRSSVTDAVSTPDGTVSQKSPLMVVGYLLDLDDKYYYVGTEADKVNTAVSIKDTMLVEEVKMPDAMDLALDGTDMTKMN